MSKIMLAFDTSGEVIALGIGAYTGEPISARGPRPFEIEFSETIPSPRATNVRLLTEIDEALAGTDYDKGDIAAIVAGRGPGSFTGVRIGIATAKGLATALEVPFFTVGTLDAIAADIARAGVAGWTIIASDAMRQEIYPALINIAEGGIERIGGDVVGKPDAIMENLIAELSARNVDQVNLVGTGLLKHSEAITGALADAKISVELLDEALSYPSGAGIIDAYSAAEDFQTGLAGDVLPVYTRLSDAEENERAKSALAATAGADDAYTSTGDTETPEAPGASLEPDVDQAQTFSVRALNPSDITEMVLLEDATAHPIWTAGAYASEFEVLGRLWIGAFVGSRLAGVAGFGDLAGEIHILNIAVAPDMRRQGIGTRLLEEGMRRCARFYAHKFTLEVRASNMAAIELYKAHGFLEVGLRTNYYSDNGEDALIMWGSSMSDEEAAVLWGSKARVARTEEGARILAIETSCDETAAAVIENSTVITDVIASQVDFHARFGGVVPEIASRKHIEAIVGTVETALEQAKRPLSSLDAIAVTDRPGLVGALVVGLAFAKGLAYGASKPLYGINHMEGHLFANVLDDPTIEPPFVALLVSGGHTSLVASPSDGVYETLGETLDDAAGEAFDKVAKALGLPYPGGPIIAKLADQGNPAAITFPRAMMHSKDYMFSFSGLKTAVITYIRAEEKAGRELNLPDIAASFQQAVIDVQVAKAVSAVKEVGATRFLLGGGVAANTALREALVSAMTANGIKVSVPPLRLCGDNAAMIAAAASARMHKTEPLALTADATSHAPLGMMGNQ